MPIHATLMKTPAIAGPRTRERLSPTWLSTTAFMSKPRSTTSPLSAIRDGPKKAKHTPWTTAETRSIQYSTNSN